MGKQCWNCGAKPKPVPKYVYGWFDGDKCLYIGMGTYKRTISKACHYRHCEDLYKVISTKLCKKITLTGPVSHEDAKQLEFLYFDIYKPTFGQPGQNHTGMKKRPIGIVHDDKYIITFESVHQAAAAVGSSPASVSQSARKGCKAAGFNFKFV